jgi:hypothetical protein
MAERSQAKLVVQRNRDSLLATPNVVGVGVGYKMKKNTQTDELCVMAMVQNKIPRVALKERDLVPKIVDGIPTDVMEVGKLRALQERTDKWRPAPGGVSLGHHRITTGTLGCVVRDRLTAERKILSNNHVLANENRGEAGDLILQPGSADGGRPSSDTLALLDRFVPIQYRVEPSNCAIASALVDFFNWLAGVIGSRQRLDGYQINSDASNIVDAALAKPVETDWISDEILDIGKPTAVSSCELGMSVCKSGRTTGFTSGTIIVVDATVNITYSEERQALFEEQIVTSAMSKGGDSGSLLVSTDESKLVGLLFAGSDQVTIYNPIQSVLDALEVEL